MATATHTNAELAEFERRRAERVLTDGAIRQVECPNPGCQAQPGQDCHSKDWYIVPQFHAARRKAAGFR